MSTSTPSTVRLVPTGAALRSPEWLALAELARTHGDGQVYLGTRGTVELRGVQEPDAARAAAPQTLQAPVPVLLDPLDLAAVEMAEHVGTALADLFAGRYAIDFEPDGGAFGSSPGFVLDPKVRPAPDDEDAAEYADLIALISPARRALARRDAADPFVVGVGSPTGDVHRHRPHLLVAPAKDQTVYTPRGERRTPVEMQGATARMLLDNLVEEALALLVGDADAGQRPATPPVQEAKKPPIGWFEEHLPDGHAALGAALPEGSMPAEYAEMIGRMDVDTVLTPWGGVVFPDLPVADADVVVRFLAPRGFVFDINSPLL